MKFNKLFIIFLSSLYLSSISLKPMENIELEPNFEETSLQNIESNNEDDSSQNILIRAKNAFMKHPYRNTTIALAITGGVIGGGYFINKKLSKLALIQKAQNDIRIGILDKHFEKLTLKRIKRLRKKSLDSNNPADLLFPLVTTCKESYPGLGLDEYLDLVEQELAKAEAAAKNQSSATSNSSTSNVDPQDPSLSFSEAAPTISADTSTNNDSGLSGINPNAPNATEEQKEKARAELMDKILNGFQNIDPRDYPDLTLEEYLEELKHASLAKNRGIFFR